MSMTSPPAAHEELSLGALLRRARARLAACDVDPGLEAESLLGHIAELPRSTLLAFPERRVESSVATSFFSLVERRARGEPLAYLVGRREFYSLPLEITPDVLVPRPESELLVEQLLERMAPGAGRRVLDLGTGSGALALAIKQGRSELCVVGIDSSRAALDVARRNAERLGIDIEWRLSTWFDALVGERFDAIVCNPPYVASDDPYFEGALRYEPRVALDGGPDGLDAFRTLLPTAREHLEAGAWLLLEHGYDQQAILAELAYAAGYRVAAALRDLAGRPRTIVLKWPGR